METDVVYFTRRAFEERSAETRAINQLARDHHAQMAANFEELAAESLKGRAAAAFRRS